jgi:hypothetical protein
LKTVGDQLEVMRVVANAVELLNLLVEGHLPDNIPRPAIKILCERGHRKEKDRDKTSSGFLPKRLAHHSSGCEGSLIESDAVRRPGEGIMKPATCDWRPVFSAGQQLKF